VSWMGMQLRRLADARAATLGLAGLALLTAFLFAVAPRAIDAQADVALRSTVSAATADMRNIAVSQTGRISSGGSTDPMAVVAATGDDLFSRVPQRIAALVAARYQVVDTPRFRPLGHDSATLRLRYLQAATDHVNLLRGALPTGAIGRLAVEPGTLKDGLTASRFPLTPPDSLPTVEIALSADSAHALGVDVGDTLTLETDSTDTLAGYSVAYVAVKVVGIFDVPDVTADFWFGDPSLAVPQIRSLSQLRHIDDVTALMAADAYPGLLDATDASGLPMRYTWRLDIDAARLSAASNDSLLADLRRMESVYLASASGDSGLTPVTLQDALLRLLVAYAASWRSVSQTLSVAEAGSAAVALVALALVCALAGRRRAPSLASFRSRGASRGQLLRGALTEAAVVLAAPMAAGTAVAVALVPNRALATTLVAAGAVFLVAFALVVGGALSTTDGAAGEGRAGAGRGSEDATRRRPGAVRLAFETALVCAAIVGVFVLRQRGVAATGATNVLASPDPLLAAVPVIAGAAAALVVARLLPLPLALFARVAERRRGLVGLLAMRRATRRTYDRLLLVALLTIAAVWSFAAISLDYLGKASETSSWHDAGAAYQVILTGGTIPDDLRLDKVGGVRSVALATTLGGHVPDTNAPLSLMAIDAADYRRVLSGTFLDGTVPDVLVNGAGTSAAGDQPAAVPAIVSDALVAEAHLTLGGTFDIAAANARTTFVVAAVRSTFPTLAPGAQWVVVDRSALATGLREPLEATQAFIAADASAGPAIAARLQQRLPSQGRVVDRATLLDGLRGSPDYVAVVFGLTAASLVVALYGALAIIAALLLVGAEEADESAHLRVMGLTRGESFRLAALEHGPSSIMVIAAGIALGAGLFVFLRSSLGLGSMVGGDIDVGGVVEPLGLALVFGAIALVVSAAIALEAVVESIINPAAALRRGLE